MTQEATGGLRELTVLVRADGEGELRDGGRVTRMRAADSDELRGMLMERALAVAFDEGVDVHVTTIDIDGVYDLLCTADGQVDEVGDMRPLQPGDNDLTPEAPTRQTDGGYAALFGLDVDEPSTDVDAPSVPVHETERLPREAMMAKLDYDELLRGEETAQDEDAELSTQGLFDGAKTGPVPVGEADELLDEEVDDEFHDEGLDHDFDELDEQQAAADDAAPAEQEGAAESGETDSAEIDETDPAESDVATDRPPFEQTPGAKPPVWRDRPADAAPPAWRDQDATVEDAADPDEWQPNFLRGRDANAAPAPTPHQSPAAARAAQAAASVASEHGGSHDRRATPPKPAHRPNTEGVPTLDDFFAEKSPERKRPAEQGWRANLRRMTGGLITLGPGAKERTRREEIASIQRTFQGPRTIVVMNPKGGAHKTTATLMIAATFGTMRGGYTLAWDNNETRGTLGWRSRPGVNKNTAVDLLRELPRFEISGGMTIADVDRYVRNQGDAKFDVLASDDDAASAAIIDDDAFSRLHTVLSRFYRIMVIDTGNNMRASNWEAALDVADQLVIVSTAREDTAASAAWLADGLRERGYGDKLANAVTILSSPSEKEDTELTQKLTSHFQQLTRAVVSVPYDQEFVGGGELDIPSLQPATLEAWRHAAAVISQGL
ncbi:MinD/ParA family ATP-binding protein [Gulosibacter sp. ACHW.36C]|uniref:Chromosome partitioning protein n=1 Tax=Gulosibacter sediminis TaxID=1729695 RepID=A0ABY4MZ38_9MICO|nr:chromosome partitioning protein [Gulosibacter sediminis]UQN14263.1 chromosome partitioning protein [Gulosibacter sediminis]